MLFFPGDIVSASRSVKLQNFLKGYINNYFLYVILMVGAKVDRDFRISDLVKSPDGTDV